MTGTGRLLGRIAGLTLLVAAEAAIASATRLPAFHWTQAHSQHFLIYSDGGAGAARHIAAQLERVRQALHLLLPELPLEPIAPLEVIAVRDRNDFAALEPPAYRARADPSLAGVFTATDDRNIVLLRLDAAPDQHPDRTLYRAYMGLLLERLSKPAPVWLRIGMEEMVGTAEVSQEQVSLGAPEPAWLQTLLWQPRVPLKALVRAPDDGPAFEAEAWALADLLLVHDARGKPGAFAGAFAHATSGEFAASAEMDRQLKDFIRGPVFPRLLVPLAPEDDKSASTIASLSQADGTAMLAGLLANEGREDDAQARARDALPDPAAAQAMGRIALGRGDWAAARRWYCQAAAAGAGDFASAFHCGAAELHLHRADMDAATATAIELQLRRAIQLRPVFAPAYDQLAVAYGLRREQLDTAARLEAQAIQLDPGQPRYRDNREWILQIQRQTSDFQRFVGPQQGTASRVITGTIVEVECGHDPTGASFPIRIAVRTTAGIEHLQARDYLRVPFEAENFTPAAPMNPCTALKGLHARVQAAGNRIVEVWLSR